MYEILDTYYQSMPNFYEQPRMYLWLLSALANSGRYEDAQILALIDQFEAHVPLSDRINGFEITALRQQLEPKPAPNFGRWKAQLRKQKPLEPLIQQIDRQLKARSDPRVHENILGDLADITFLAEEIRRVACNETGPFDYTHAGLMIDTLLSPKGAPIMTYLTGSFFPITYKGMDILDDFGIDDAMMIAAEALACLAAATAMNPEAELDFEKLRKALPLSNRRAGIQSRRYLNEFNELYAGTSALLTRPALRERFIEVFRTA